MLVLIPSSLHKLHTAKFEDQKPLQNFRNKTAFHLTLGPIKQPAAQRAFSFLDAGHRGFPYSGTPQGVVTEVGSLRSGYKPQLLNLPYSNDECLRYKPLFLNIPDSISPMHMCGIWPVLPKRNLPYPNSLFGNTRPTFMVPPCINRFRF